MWFGCSKETSHLDGFYEYPQYMFSWRNKKSVTHSYLGGGGAVIDTGFSTKCIKADR